ncbi:MBL fold metallo-hydrolase [Rossellomorea aquimaris]|uniref:MBL fold metallo-hydrolase n=1 Tax=Rossellomorea aquimaris TaxID=189382 RepID=UPI001CD4AA92|nr:MBL fold metallo-hydrolase [Rossellomorea aquimaris]MCA1056706.1 MBL fold metallo-hydrolase [Rossellomorea aquimaris]
MDFKQFSDHCFAFTGAVNIGYCLKEGKGLLIDTGLDESAIRKVLKVLDGQSLPLDYAIITHAHSDHFGGAQYLKEMTGVPLYAPPFEASIMRHPIIEPVYLFNGANPLAELRNKFLEGPPVVVDHLLFTGKTAIGPFAIDVIDLKGHSYAQAGILIEGILYAADGFFGRETLKKHVIPFIIDADETLDSLEKLLHIECKGAIPGHGPFENDLTEIIRQNQEVHYDLRSELFHLIEEKDIGETIENLTRKLLNLHNIKVKTLGQWLLFRTSVTAYLTSLERQERIRFFIHENEPRVAAR